MQIDEAINGPRPIGRVRKHEMMEQLAAQFIQVGATNPANALPVSKVVKKLAADFAVSDSAIYKLFKERIGFVPTYTRDGIAYYYEVDRLQPLAEQQGAKFYPKDISPLWAFAGSQQCDHIFSDEDYETYRRTLAEQPESQIYQAIKLLVGLRHSEMEDFGKFMLKWAAVSRQQQTNN